jgi:hypothetical protein
MIPDHRLMAGGVGDVGQRRRNPLCVYDGRVSLTAEMTSTFEAWRVLR